MTDRKNTENLKSLLRLDQAIAMTDKRKVENLNFLNKLRQAVADANKNNLLSLARDVIDKSHNGRSFSERRSRDLRVNPAGINMGATFGLGHAMTNADLSTNDKLYMVMNEYINVSVAGNPKASKDRALAKFCYEFETKYPKEFGATETERHAPSPQITDMMLGQQSRGIV